MWNENQQFSKMIDKLLCSCQFSTGSKMDGKECNMLVIFTDRARWHLCQHWRHWNTHSHSSLMGHFKPTPQNSCWPQGVIMMLLSVTEGFSGFVAVLLSLCVSDVSLRALRSFCTIALRCPRSRCCSSEETSPSRKTRTRRPSQWTSGSSSGPPRASLTWSR